MLNFIYTYVINTIIIVKYLIIDLNKDIQYPYKVSYVKFSIDFMKIANIDSFLRENCKI